MSSRSWVRSFVLAGALMGSVASADPVYVSVGQTKYLNLSRNVKRATAADGSLINVKRQSGRTVALTGVAPGKTEVRLNVSGGEQILTEVHVVPAGASVYAAGRESSQLRARVVADSEGTTQPAAATAPPASAPATSADL